MSRHRTKRTCRSLAVGFLATLSGGCQSYEAQPVDLPAHRAAFLARTPDSPEVRAFAEAMLRREPGDASFDLADGVTCAEAELIALVYNSELRVARLQAGVTRAAADNAGLWEDPTLSVDLARILESTPDQWKAFGALGLTIPISGRLEAEKARASTELAVELARVAYREWSLRMALRHAWNDWSALDAQLAATREFVSRAEQILGVVDTMERAGEMPRTEARLFRIERIAKGADLAMLESSVRMAELQIKRLMGLAPDAAITLRPGVTSVPLDGGEDRASIADRSPLVKIALAEHAVAEKALLQAIRAQYPDLQLGPGFGREDGMDQVLLGISAPLPIFNANRGAIAEARALREVARASAEAALEQAVAEVQTAEVRMDAIARRRASLEREIVPLVDAQYADARELAKLGEVNTLVLLESLTRQHEVKLLLISALRDESHAAIDLESVLGPPHEFKTAPDDVQVESHDPNAPAPAARP